MTSTEVVQAEPLRDRHVDLAHLSVGEMQRVAQIFYKAGTFKSVKNEAEALVKIIAGQELGVAPMQAMNGIHMVDGEPRLSAGLVGALVKRSGRYDYRVIEANDTVCVLEWLQNGTPVGRSEFTGEEADRITVHTKGGGTRKLTAGAGWMNYREDMLFARALTRGARRFCPDVFGGAVYTLGEEVTDADERPSYEEHVARFEAPMLPRPVGDLAETGSAPRVRGPLPSEETSEGTAPDDAGSRPVPGGEDPDQLDLGGAA